MQCRSFAAELAAIQHRKIKISNKIEQSQYLQQFSGMFLIQKEEIQEICSRFAMAWRSWQGEKLRVTDRALWCALRILTTSANCKATLPALKSEWQSNHGLSDINIGCTESYSNSHRFPRLLSLRISIQAWVKKRYLSQSPESWSYLEDKLQVTAKMNKCIVTTSGGKGTGTIS